MLKLTKYIFLTVIFLNVLLNAQMAEVWFVEQDNALKTNVPVTFGHVFAKGDVPAGMGIEARSGTGALLATQVDAKAFHSDGSLRHAVVTIIIPLLNPGETKRILLETSQKAGSGTPLTLEHLLTSAYDARIEISIDGEQYYASARDLLQTTQEPFIWLAGELTTEWHVTAPVRQYNGEAHPHLQARFYIRAYQGFQDIRTSVILENNWSYEPDPSGIEYDVSVTIAGEERYSADALAHTHHSRWRKVFWWGGDADIAVKHHIDYLARTKAVPNYDRNIQIDFSAIAGMRTEYEPMSNGDINDYMPEAGAQDGIGPLPRWAALYLLSMNPQARKNVIANGDAAASYHIHYRDKQTDLPVRLDDYPYMTLLGSDSDTYNPETGEYESFPPVYNSLENYVPDAAHQPSLAYVPYLITGDYYFLEELHFWANFNMIEGNPPYRGFEKGLFKWRQVRGQAWSLRTLAQAAYITPDDHPLKRYFVDRINDNIDFYEQAFVHDPNANMLGYVDEGYALVYEPYGIAPWQDDFFTWAVGHTVELGFDHARALFLWKSRFVLGRMATSGYCWLNAPAYSLQVLDNNGAKIETFAELYQFNGGGSDCSGAEMVGYPDSPTGYGANMQPALALVREAGITDSDLAWGRYESRQPKQDYSRAPQFAVVPREETDLKTLSSPIIEPGGGVFENEIEVQIYSPNNAAIYYTLNGLLPDENSIRYTAPFILSHSAQLSAVCYKQGFESSDVSTVDFEITVDATPPEIVAISAYTTPAQVVVRFSEPVESTSAENSANYRIDNGVIVAAATLDETGMKVTLTVNELVDGVEYTLVVSNIADRAATPNIIPENTKITFHAGYLQVELSSFRAVYSNGEMNVQWTVESETLSLGFNVFRKLEKNSDFFQVNESLIETVRENSVKHNYHYFDRDVIEGETYNYLLHEISINGKTTKYGPISARAVEDNEKNPTSVHLYPNFPNPFNLETRIKYDVPGDAHVKLEIYDVAGKHIRTLVDHRRSAGRHVNLWDGRNSHGVLVGSGEFFYRLIVGNTMKTEKMILLK